MNGRSDDTDLSAREVVAPERPNLVLTSDILRA
jgi:hypothetical protein